MDITHITSLLGGIALFLYGMSIMGAGLEKLAGGKMQGVLQKLTSSTIKGVIFGTLITGVIQSSAGTVVICVGLVNSGIMTLTQSVGVIMGANIGTTVTSWLLSLTGIESSNFLISMLKPSSFSPVLALIGIIMYMSGKDKKKDIGEILLGFAILMFGMETMSDAVKPLADVPEFTDILTMFNNPVFGVLAGALLTAVIQSSSASVGILQALSVTGAFTYGSVIPIILGQNIGTCVTAMISAIGANRGAKRTAFVHLYFNIIGTLLFLTVFYIGNAIFRFEFVGETVGIAGIALIHSIFNVFTTVVLFPFIHGLEKLAYLTIPESDEEKSAKEDVFAILDERFVSSPAFAIEQCKTLVNQMAEITKNSFIEAMECIKEPSDQKFAEVIAKENRVDVYDDKISAYLTKLNSGDLSYTDSLRVTSLLHCLTDFERISDHARNIKEAAQEMHDKQLVFSEKAQEELKVFERAVHDVLDLTMTSFKNGDLNLARQVEPLEEVIDGLSLDVKQRHVRRLRKGKCTIELGFILSDVITNFERVSDHCSNIAVCLVQVNEDEFDTHAYLDELRQEDNLDFQGKVMACREKYQLPPTKQDRVIEYNAKLLAE